MKPTAVLLTVILLIAATLFIGGSLTTHEETGSATPVYMKASVKEDKAAPLPQSPNRQNTAPTLVKSEYKKPVINKIEGKVAITQRDNLPLLPQEKDTTDLIFNKVEIEAEYPGGAAAWQRFLNRNLRVPVEVIENDIQGSVVVQFVVDEEGNVSNVETVSGPEALGAEAVRVIKKSGKWTPAVQGGRCVKSLKKQPFIIHFESEE